MSFDRPALDNWQGMKLTYRRKGSIYNITYEEEDEQYVEIEGIKMRGDLSVALKENQGRCDVRVVFSKS